ncbi:hypothetical protein ACNOYE_34865 [Nannocystaceae bacterium ST9]
MRTLARGTSLLAISSTLACFNSGSDDGADEVGTETDGDDATDTDTGDTTETTGSDTTTDVGDSAPVFESFTIDGSTTPEAVTAAAAVALAATVTDADGDLDRVEFELDGAIAGEVTGAGPDVGFEWIVSGAELNGGHMLRAIAWDMAGNSTMSEIIELELDMPASGEVDAWVYDGGSSDAAYAIATDPEGTRVLLTGQSIQQGASVQRTDAVLGPSWTDKVVGDSAFGSAIVLRDNGETLVAGGWLVDMSSDSIIYRYGADGAEIEVWAFDGNKPEGATEIVDSTLDMEALPSGDLIVLGSYVPQSGPLMNGLANYVARITATGDQEWLRWPSEDVAFSSPPLIYELSTADDGGFALGGGRLVGGVARAVWARYDDAGQLVDQSTMMAGEASVAHAVELTDAGDLYLAGQITIAGAARPWLGHYLADGSEDWTLDIPASEGVTAAVGVDPFGEVVTVSTEDCVVTPSRYEECALVVRKYDGEGSLMWEVAYADEIFSGPVFALPGFDASLAFDRYGYVYVSAIVYTPAGTDWWARKLNP